MLGMQIREGGGQGMAKGGWLQRVRPQGRGQGRQDLLHGTEVTNTHRTQKNGVIKAPTIHFPLDILLLLNRDSRGGRGGTNGRVAGG